MAFIIRTRTGRVIETAGTFESRVDAVPVKKQLIYETGVDDDYYRIEEADNDNNQVTY